MRGLTPVLPETGSQSDLSMSTIDELAHAAESGNGAAAVALFAALYRELHDLAERHLRRSGGRLTLGTTTLLHEAYIKLSNLDGAVFPDRSRFLAYASKAIRRLVIDYARAKRAAKRGGDFEITRLGDVEPADATPEDDESLQRLRHAMEELSEINPDLAQIVDLHFFAGFKYIEIAALTGTSERTVQRNWRKARAMLRRLIEDAPV